MRAFPKNQNMNRKTQRQALQFFRQVPVKLAPIFELANKVLSEPLLTDVNHLVELNAALQGDEWSNQAQKVIAACLEGQSEELRNYVWHDSPYEGEAALFVWEDGFHVIEAAYFRCVDVFRAYSALAFVVQLVELNDPAYGLGVPSQRGVRGLRVDEQGVIRISIDPLMEALKGVEAARIRRCAICKRFFWAGRITQKCCSKQCANNYRVRRFRDKTEEEKLNYKHRRYERESKRAETSNTKKGSQ